VRASPPTSRRRTVGSGQERERPDREVLPLCSLRRPTRRAARRRRARPWARRGEALAIHAVVDQGDALGGREHRATLDRLGLETATIASQRGAGRARPTGTAARAAADEPRPVVGRDDHPGRGRRASSPRPGPGRPPSTSAGAPRLVPSRAAERRGRPRPAGSAAGPCSASGAWRRGVPIPPAGHGLAPGTRRSRDVPR
jgi:hypothetical protein